MQSSLMPRVGGISAAPHKHPMRSEHATSVLNAYRELLRLIRRLPEAQRLQNLQEARTAMRAHAGETDGGQQQELFKQLAAKISFLRVVTPRRAGEVSSIGAGHYVMREGKLVEGYGSTGGTRWVPCYLPLVHAPVGRPLSWC